MPKKWVPSGKGPEGRTYFVEVRMPKLRKKRGAPPPPEDPPEFASLPKTKPMPPGTTQAAEIARALEEKESG